MSNICSKDLTTKLVTFQASTFYKNRLQQPVTTSLNYIIILIQVRQRYTPFVCQFSIIYFGLLGCTVGLIIFTERFFYCMHLEVRMQEQVEFT